MIRSIFVLSLTVLITSCSSTRDLQNLAKPIIKSEKRVFYFPKSTTEVQARDIALSTRRYYKLTCNKDGQTIEKREYNKKGKLWYTSIYARDKHGNVIEHKFSSPRRTIIHYTNQFEYDADSHMIKETRTDKISGEITTTRFEYYKGNLVSKEQINPNTVKRTEYVYNHRGQCKRELQFEDGELNESVYYKYNKQGNRKEQLRQSTSGSFHKFTFEYNVQGDAKTFHSYDINDELIRVSTYQYVYDRHGNWITRKTYHDGNIGGVFEKEIEYFP